MKISKKALIPFIIILELIIAEIFMGKIEFLRYSDELVAVFFFLYLCSIYLRKKKVDIFNGRIILICFILLVLGIIPNIVFKQQESIVAIILDIVANFKMPVICIGFSYMLNEKVSVEISKKLGFISKLFLIIGLALGVLSLFIDLGMRGQERFGLWGYNFIFDYAHVYALMILFFLFFAIQNSKTNRKIIIFNILASAQLMLTLKGPSFVAAMLLLIFPLFIKNIGKLKKKHFIAIGLISIIFGMYQIKTYFLNENAPRLILLKYGIKTANQYLPFGAGFATYGSDMAAKYYSKLYYNYGFDSLYGMNSINYQFLNDNYWPSIMGQFGYVGVILVLIILYSFFIRLQNKKIDYKKKSIILTSFIYILVSSLGNTIFTTSSAIVMMIGLIIILKCNSLEGGFYDESK